MDNNYEIKGKKFKLNKIDAFKQFHIVRRLAPVLKDMIPAAVKFQKLQKNGVKFEDMSEEESMAAVGPIIEGFSKLSDQDSEKVFLGLLQSVEMQQESGNWARLASNDGLMFQNMELPLLMQIAGRAFMFNIQGFFSVLPQVSPGQSTAQ